MICYNYKIDQSDCRWYEDGYYRADFKGWQLAKEPCQHKERIYEHKNAFWIFIAASISVWMISSVTGYMSAEQLK